MATLETLSTPAVVIDRSRLLANIHQMQATCDAHGIELRPHIKTHKMTAIAREQLAAGARGLTCAKLGEAEAMLPSGVRELFVAHSLVDPAQAPRVAALAERLQELRVGLTSTAHLEPLSRLAARAGRKLSVMMAVDTGLGREGVRSDAEAKGLAAQLARHPHLELRGLYCHEGHFYGLAPEQAAAATEQMIDRMDRLRHAIDPQLALWPGCSVTARQIVGRSLGRVQAVRPGAYVFGDLHLTTVTRAMTAEQVAVTTLATVVDRPEPGLALIDAGSKSFSSDRTPDSVFGRAADGRDLSVVRVNEEHGYVRGADVDRLRPGDRVAFVPAHVCPVINLTDTVVVADGNTVFATWSVEGRGRTQ